jgi:hypothetical protein
MAMWITASIRITGMQDRFQNVGLKHSIISTPMKHGMGADMLATRATTAGTNGVQDSQVAATQAADADRAPAVTRP